MKLLIFISLYVAVVNSMVVDKAPTLTSNEPTKINKYKRAKSTSFIDGESYIVFDKTMETLNEDWVSDGWNLKEDAVKIIDGTIQVDMPAGAGFAISSRSLDSQYGELTFEYKLSVTDSTTKLNLLTYEGDNPDKYIYLQTYLYSGEDYDTVKIPIKNYQKNEYISSIKRFAFQNYDNNKDYKLYLRKIVYKDIKIEVEKYEAPISIIDTKECKLSPYWEDISENPNIFTFEMVDNECIIKIDTVMDEGVSFKFKSGKFYGGKFEMVTKSENNGSLIYWSASNSDDPDTFKEGKSYQLTTSYNTYVDNELEDVDSEYDTINISTFSDKLECSISKLTFAPILVDCEIQLYETTHIDEPDVILSDGELLWDPKIWGSTKCEREEVNGYMECSFEGKPSSWPGFGFQTNNSYDKGTLVVEMKVLNPNQSVNIICFDTDNVNHNVETFLAKTEFDIYKFKLLHFDELATNAYAIQEASQQDNTYYIKNIVYYPDYIEIPSSPIPTRTKTNTKTPTDPPKTEEEIYNEKGYNSCTLGTKVSFTDVNGIWGIENDKWCAILSKNLETCWSILYGYKCCTESATVNEGSAWGNEEDGTKCGIQNACWAEELGYECCSRKDTNIIFIDENGLWGATKDNKWCGIV